MVDLFRVRLLFSRRSAGVWEVGGEGRGCGVRYSQGIGHSDVAVGMARNTPVDVEDPKPVVDPVHLIHKTHVRCHVTRYSSVLPLGLAW